MYTMYIGHVHMPLFDEEHVTKSARYMDLYGIFLQCNAQINAYESFCLASYHN